MKKELEVEYLTILRHTLTLIINIPRIDQFNEGPYIKYWDVNNFYGWVMSKKLPVNDFKWTEDISELEESFIKSYSEESDGEYFCEFDIQNQ